MDLRWNQILQKQETCLRFALNAVQDSFPTPRRLKHWQQYGTSDISPLGFRATGLLLQILCQCQKAVKEEPQSRITWRHDSIWVATCKGVKDQIKEATESRVWRLEWRILLFLSLIWVSSLQSMPSPLKQVHGECGR